MEDCRAALRGRPCENISGLQKWFSIDEVRTTKEPNFDFDTGPESTHGS